VTPILEVLVRNSHTLTSGTSEGVSVVAGEN
jgi:hypothetical protein